MDSINIMSWNIRGINNAVARRNLIELIRDSRGDIICIQETKSEVWTDELEKFVSSLVNYRMTYQPARGLSGGLVTFWKHENLSRIAFAQSTSWIWITFRTLRSNTRLHVVNVYSPQKLDCKRSLWEDMQGITGCVGNEALCFIGDFNCVRFKEERFRCIFSSRESEEFNSLVKGLNLLEVQMINARYTWFGAEGKKSKLDRALMNAEWCQTAQWEVLALCRKQSDHKPILLQAKVSNKIERPFKLFNYHLKEALLENLKSKVLQNSSWGNLNIHQALKEIKVLIKESTKSNSGGLEGKIKCLEDKLTDLEEKDDPESEQEKIRNELQELYLAKESMLRQKSRITWFRLGDGNTKFYHQAIQKRLCKNKITSLLWNKAWISGQANIKNAFFQHFSSFYQGAAGSLLSLGSLNLPQLSEESSRSLTQSFGRLEVERALGSLPNDKAPGPDGFNMRSMKFMWPFVCEKVFKLIEDFHTHSFIPPGVNSSFIVLVPKVPNPKSVKDFRPISLINSSIKILLKLLASRLANHMQTLVSDVQTGFVKGRQASESIIVIKEVVHSIQRGKCKGCVLKIDFEKAFDTVNWSFLLQVMRRMNFDSKWCNWIQSMLESSRISVLVNGSPSKEFSPSRGLRQGDPISPLLFDLVGEVLHSMLTQAANKGIFQGIRLNKNMEQITHLQFADDTVIFLDGSIQSAIGIKRVLQCFQLMSGLKINFDKSELFFKSSNAEQMDLCNILNCKQGLWPMKYLGVPIGTSSKKRIFWAPLIQKMMQKLAKWKADNLNMAGRLTLVKAVLDGLPTYWMNVYKVPSTVAARMEQIRRNFLWGHFQEQFGLKKKLHAIAWKKICKPKDQGGLGIVSIKTKNLALLSKWFYRWEHERCRKWNQWVRQKYNFDSSEGLIEGLNRNGLSTCLKNIITASDNKVLNKILKHESFSWKLRNGISIYFWEDLWTGSSTLMTRFKRLYQLSTLKKLSVAEFLQSWERSKSSGVTVWTRALRSWEIEELEILVGIIQTIKLTPEEDELVWVPSNKPLTVKKVTELLTPYEERVYWDFIWKLKIPQKIRLFLWKVHSNALPTKDLLASRGILANNETWCPQCRASIETIWHIFCDCPVAVEVWSKIMCWWVISRPFKYNYTLHELWNKFSGSKSKKIKAVWRIVVAATLWALWLNRNGIIFKDLSLNSEEIIAVIKVQSKEWCLAFSIIHRSSLLWWNANPVGSVTNSVNSQLSDLLSAETGLIGFIDGSWKFRKGMHAAGIGGFVQDSKNNVILTFSGPTSAENSLEAEGKALACLVDIFKTSRWHDHSLSVYSDSKILVKRFLEWRLNGKDTLGGIFLSMGNMPNIKLHYISADINIKADKLAKLGINRGKLSQFLA